MGSSVRQDNGEGISTTTACDEDVNVEAFVDYAPNGSVNSLSDL